MNKKLKMVEQILNAKIRVKPLSMETFTGVIYPPTTTAFEKLYKAEEEEIPFVFIVSSGKYLFSRRRKILVHVQTFLFDSLDQELKCKEVTKKFGFFGKTVFKRIAIYYSSIKDVEFLIEQDHKQLFEKFGIDTTKYMKD